MPPMIHYPRNRYENLKDGQINPRYLTYCGLTPHFLNGGYSLAWSDVTCASCRKAVKGDAKKKNKTLKQYEIDHRALIHKTPLSCGVTQP